MEAGLVNQLVANCRRSGLEDTALIEKLDSTLHRVKRGIGRMNAKPHPGPEYPDLPPVDADAYVARVRTAVLAKLSET